MVERSSIQNKSDHDSSGSPLRGMRVGTTDVENPSADEPLAETDGKNPHAVALGRLGGKKGGKARAAKLTSEERRDIAKKAAAARWGKSSSEIENGNRG